MLAAPSVAQAETPPEEPVAGTPYVHIDSNDPSAILLRMPRSPWERATLGPAYRDLGVPICRAPCDTTIDARRDDLLLVSSSDPDFPRSPRFRLDPTRDVRLGVEAGSARRRGGGVALLVVGGVLTGVGLFVSVFTAIGEGNDPGRGHTNYAAIGGLATAGVGVVSMVGGGAVVASNRTNVEVFQRPGIALGGSARLEGLRLVF
jgi:hypothetical protein